MTGCGPVAGGNRRRGKKIQENAEPAYKGKKAEMQQDKKMRLNILFLIFSFHVGGIERQLIEIANSMAERGYTVHLCVINSSYDREMFESLHENVHIFRMERSPQKGKLSYMTAFCRYVRRNQINVIHAQEPTGVVFALLTRICLPHLRIVETIHDVGEADEYSALQLKLADLFCSRYVAISETVKKELLARGIGERRIRTIHNAVNTEKFCCHRKEEDLRDETDVQKVWRIANVARFYPAKKGQDILLKAADLLHRQHPQIPIRVFLAGAVYRGQDQAFEEAKHFVIEHDLTEIVTFCGNVENVPGFLEKMDVFVLPSRYEGFGIALIEAMAMGIPCVASRLDGPQEILGDHPEAGRLFASENAEDLAAQLLYVMEHYTEYSPAAISRYAKQEYGMDRLVEQHLLLYRELLGS